MYGNEEINFRVTERDAMCRGCDKIIKRHEEKVIAFHTYRNRGQHIYICDDCLLKMFKLSGMEV